MPDTSPSTPRVRIGTSGWSYDHWSGVFYPDHVAPARRLEYYATRFDTVEIDATFYRMPSEHAVLAWLDEVPQGFAFAVKGSRFVTHFRRLAFAFAVKGSRFVTHFRRLAGAEEATGAFLERVGLLGHKLEVVLWQLPPNLKRDTRLLDAFLAGLSAAPVRHAVEFRHESWLCDETFDVLRAHGAAHVSVSSDEMPEERTVTAGFVYVRFHGTETYHGAYQRPALEPWADFLATQRAEGRDIYAYFNNDAEGHAPRDAERLAAMLGERAAPARVAP